MILQFCDFFSPNFSATCTLFVQDPLFHSFSISVPDLDQNVHIMSSNSLFESLELAYCRDGNAVHHSLPLHKSQQ